MNNVLYAVGERRATNLKYLNSTTARSSIKSKLLFVNILDVMPRPCYDTVLHRREVYTEKSRSKARGSIFNSQLYNFHVL